MTIGERLKQVRGAMSQDEMAKALGVHKNTVANYEKGDRVPDAEYLMKVVEKIEGVDAGWLLTGKEPARKGVRVEEPEGKWHSLPNLSPERRLDDRYCYIPLYNVSASAGGGALVDQEHVVDTLAFKASWIRTHLNATQQDLYLIHVEGESMEPTLRPGDVILVDHREGAQLPRDGIYVLRMDDSLLVKRLQRMPGSQVRVSSDNPAYEPFTVSLAQGKNEMEIVGRVVWCGRRM
jgi:phage repressor protein C with HTH and peptisase S24 domain